MGKKSKFDYEVENFNAQFEKYKDKNVVLYGTGRMTATLVNRIKGFKIIGLCDREKSLIGEEKYGLPVLSKQEAEEKADILIINTSATYWNTIYHRIKNWNIPIYFLNGELAIEQIKDRTNEQYWKTSMKQLKVLIDKHEVVSFDIFDTLVMRKVLFPIDIFRLTEIQLDRLYGIKTDFTSIRKRAAAMLNIPTLDEIYKKILEITQKSIEEIKKWKEIEIETEKRLLTKRADMVQLCNETMKKKQVFFISDMYYPREILKDLLNRIGLRVEEKQIIVSCEQKKTKEDGSLWDYYIQDVIRKKKAIHIGDNAKADIKNAQKYGIIAYHVLNSYDMLQKSTICTIAPLIDSLFASIAMGLICSRIFNSPFALNNTKGKIVFVDDEEAGYCILGSLIYSFMEWLIYHAMKDEIKKLVFFSREGYLLIPIYNFLKQIKEMREEGNLPDALYLEISRRTVWNASIFSKRDIYTIAQFPFTGNLKQFLKERFGVETKNKEAERILVEKEQNSIESMKNILSCYEKDILNRAYEERKSYLKYFDSLNIKEKYAIVDSQFYGSTQYYLSKVLNNHLKGYYMCVCTSTDNQYLDRNEMRGCFQMNERTEEKDINVHKQAQFLESFFTSPKGMIEFVESSGRKKYSKEMLNQVFFEIRLQMTEGIKTFISEMAEIQYDLGIMERDEIWADKFFGCIMNQGFEPSEKMKKSFYFDNYVSNKREMPIWE